MARVGKVRKGFSGETPMDGRVIEPRIFARNGVSAVDAEMRSRIP